MSGSGPDQSMRLPGGHFVAATLAAARAHADALGVPAPDELRDPRPPHALVPSVGTVREVVRTVAEQDTAAAVGHPDEGVEVLSTPTIALWFELTASELMPPPGEVSHVGVGVVVHHLGAAAVGDDVTVRTSVERVDGRAVVFACLALLDGRPIATGDHQRVIIESG